MRKYLSLTKRNCLVFLRDRSAVFFSLLSMMIVLMLTGVFLGNMNVENITELLAQYGAARNSALDRENALHLVQYWTLAGIMIVNAVTVTLTAVGVMVHDASENRLDSFYTAPAGRNMLALSYVTSAAVIGTFFCLLTLGAALAYIWITGGSLLSCGTLGQVMVYIFLNVCIYAVIMFLAALFVKSTSAWSGIATIAGTLVGFLGAVYIPMGSLPEGVTRILRYTPVLHGASLMRGVFCREALSTAFAGIPAAVTEQYKEYMGITIKMPGGEAAVSFQILFLCICGIVALAAAARLIRRRKSSDR